MPNVDLISKGSFDKTVSTESYVFLNLFNSPIFVPVVSTESLLSSIKTTAFRICWTPCTCAFITLFLNGTHVSRLFFLPNDTMSTMESPIGFSVYAMFVVLEKEFLRTFMTVSNSICRCISLCLEMIIRTVQLPSGCIFFSGMSGNKKYIGWSSAIFVLRIVTSETISLTTV